MAANTFTFPAATTVVFPSAPAAGKGRRPSRIQPNSRTRTGVLYLYDRGVKPVSHRLTFNKVPSAILANLYALTDSSTRGGQKTFSWYDQDNSLHTVSLSGAIETVEGPAGFYRVSLTLEELL